MFSSAEVEAHPIESHTRMTGAFRRHLPCRRKKCRADTIGYLRLADCEQIYSQDHSSLKVVIPLLPYVSMVVF